MGEGVVVGVDGGVFVGCVAAEVGVEECQAGGDGVFGVAVLVEDCVGGVGQGCGYGQGYGGSGYWG